MVGHSFAGGLFLSVRHAVGSIPEGHHTIPDEFINGPGLIRDDTGQAVEEVGDGLDQHLNGRCGGEMSEINQVQEQHRDGWRVSRPYLCKQASINESPMAGFITMVIGTRAFITSVTMAWGTNLQAALTANSIRSFVINVLTKKNLHCM